MKTEYSFHIVHISGMEHSSGSANRRHLLRRLEDQFHRSGDLFSSLAEKHCSTKKTRHMVVMSAGMHNTVILGLIRNLIHLLDL